MDGEDREDEGGVRNKSLQLLSSPWYAHGWSRDQNKVRPTSTDTRKEKTPVARKQACHYFWSEMSKNAAREGESKGGKERERSKLQEDRENEHI